MVNNAIYSEIKIVNTYRIDFLRIFVLMSLGLGGLSILAVHERKVHKPYGHFYALSYYPSSSPWASAHSCALASALSCPRSSSQIAYFQIDDRIRGE